MPFKSDEELEEIRQGIYDEAWPLISDVDNKTWTLKKGKRADDTGLLFQFDHRKYGTIWKLQVEINITPDEYCRTFFEKDDKLFAPRVSTRKILERGQVGEWKWIVTYIKSERVGAIASRDFVAISFYKRFEDGSFVITSSNIDHPDSPKPDSNCVRGEALPQGNILRPVSGAPNRCECHFVENKDPKGNLPKKLVNVAMASFGLDFAKALVRRVNSMNHAD